MTMRKIGIIVSVLALLAGGYVQAQEIEETTDKKSFEVNYASANYTTKYSFEYFCIDEGDFVCASFMTENYEDGKFKYGNSKGYYFYYENDKIVKIEDPGLSDNLLETNPTEWVTAFKKFADELLIMVAEKDDTERRYWKTGELLENVELKKITIRILDNEIELREGGSFPCIVHEIWGSSSYFEIKRRNGKYVVEGRKYRTIEEGIKEYLQYDFFRYYYKFNFREFILSRNSGCFRIS